MRQDADTGAGQMSPMVDPYKAATERKERQGVELLNAWITYNETMCQMIRRHGAQEVIDMATTWLNTIGRWAGTHSDGDVRP